MSAALVGLLGVIVGGLLGGVATDIVERRKRVAAARAAGLLIAEELSACATKLAAPTMPVEGPADWWSATLPTNAWESQAAALIGDLDEELIRRLAKASALVDSWNAEKQTATTQPSPTKPTSKNLTELSEQSDTVKAAGQALDEHLGAGRPVRAVRDARRVLMWGACLLALALVASTIFVTRPNVNADTVAAALEQVNGSDSFAECDRAGDDWACTITRSDAPRGQCFAARTAALPDRVQVAQAAPTPVADLSAGACSTTPDSKVQVDADGDTLRVYKTTGEAERAKFVSESTIAAPERSVFGMIKRYFFGGPAAGR